MSSLQVGLLRAVAAPLAILAAGPAYAANGPTLITMDDLSPRPLNGLVHPAGVTFGFTLGGVPNDDGATQRAVLAKRRSSTTLPSKGQRRWDPGRGAISMLFDRPAVQIEFGLAMSTGGTLPNAATVDLYDEASVLIESETFTLAQTTLFAEAKFEYAGSPIKQAVLKFNQSTEELRFAFDNLLFTVVPEPTTVALAAPLLGMLIMQRRRVQARHRVRFSRLQASRHAPSRA